MTPSSHRRAGLAGLAAAATLALSACYTPGNLGRWPTEADFMTIQPGWTSQQVLTTFGPPTWTFRVWQESLTIWNYRYYRGDCIIYQVSMRPDGVVRDAGTGWDPACDAPGSRH